MTTRRPLLSGLAAAVAGALLAAGLTGAAAPAGAQERDARAPLPVPTLATVTADQLGPDSVVAVVTHGRFEQVGAPGLARSLQVITPDGARHPVYSVDLRETRAGWHVGDFLLADWRPELHTALLRVSLGADGDKLVSYDVTTGVTREVAAPRRASTVALAPDGSGVLMTTYRRTESRAARTAVLGWDGVQSRLPGHGDGPAITSIDGTTLVTTFDRQWWVTDLTTRTTMAFDTPGYCTPHRWADADSVVASCSTRRGSQLRRVDLDGTSAPLGVRHTMRPPRTGPPVMDDADVRTVQGRSYYESYGGCGGAILTRQTPAGAVRAVRVPGDKGALSLVGTRGEQLVIAHVDDDCGSPGARSVLSLFDPRTQAETVLTRLPRRESWREVIAADEVRAWTS
jgi:hypothetical protein